MLSTWSPRRTDARPLELPRLATLAMWELQIAPAHRAPPGGALRPARAWALGRRSPEPPRSTTSAAISSSSSTSSASSGSRFVASRSAASKACGSPSTLRNGSKRLALCCTAPSFAPRQGWVDRAAACTQTAWKRYRGGRARAAGSVPPSTITTPGVVAHFRAMLVATPRATDTRPVATPWRMSTSLRASQRSALPRSSSRAPTTPS